MKSIAVDPGKYHDFTGYICYAGTEGLVEHATFELFGEYAQDPQYYVYQFSLERMTNDPYIHWKYGIWKDGLWYNGMWEDGIWLDGTWNDGVFEKGLWKKGTWLGGIFVNGEWMEGDWRGGTNMTQTALKCVSEDDVIINKRIAWKTVGFHWK